MKKIISIIIIVLCFVFINNNIFAQSSIDGIELKINSVTPNVFKYGDLITINGSGFANGGCRYIDGPVTVYIGSTKVFDKQESAAITKQFGDNIISFIMPDLGNVNINGNVVVYREYYNPPKTFSGTNYNCPNTKVLLSSNENFLMASEDDCLADKYECNNWGFCSADQNGMQTRQCNKVLDCPSIETPSPSVSQSCCVKDNYDCSNWGECSISGSQSRQCVKTFECDADDGSEFQYLIPKTTQSCTPACTNDLWSCSDWGSCSIGGVQYRTCTKSFDCSLVETAKPSEMQSCTYIQPTCTSFNYSDWSECSLIGKRTRTVLSKLPNNCKNGTPIVEENCIPKCQSFNYSNWSTCTKDGIQTRSITYKYPSNCDEITSETLSRNCSYVNPTCTSFTYSNWSVCDINGKQTRSIISRYPNDCVNGVQEQLIQNCVPQCLEDKFSCSEWTSCKEDGKKTRICNKSFDCPIVEMQQPNTSESCIYTPICKTEDFSCSEWSNCSVQGKKTRYCNKNKNCVDDNAVKPNESDFCVYTSQCTSDTWECGNWGQCSPDGVQKRACKKTFDCANIETESPDSSQFCVAPVNPNTSNNNPQNNNDISNSFNQDKIIKATVKLACFKDKNTLAGVGSGTIINESGLILTNSHVVSGTIGCKVGFVDNLDDLNIDYREIAEIYKMSYDENIDVAILKIINTNKKFNFTDIKNGLSYKIKPLEKIIISGYPVYGPATYQNLMQSNLTLTQGSYSGNYLNIFLKTDAKIQGGNSGGGAYSNDGKFLGMPTAKTIRENLTDDSIGLVTPIKRINDWINNNKISTNSTSGIYKNNVLASIGNENIKVNILDISNIKISTYPNKSNTLPLKSGIKSNYKYPVFKISGLSNIAGYYVYFGQNIGSDPEKQGKFIKTDIYQPLTINKTGTYYLIVKAKDKTGNISDSYIVEYNYSAVISKEESVILNGKEKISGPSKIKNYKNIEKVGSSLWGNRKQEIIILKEKEHIKTPKDIPNYTDIENRNGKLYGFKK